MQLAEEEVARLQALLDCHILDTPPEELFDQTARLAAYLCGTPIGLIGFIDGTRQWFKSRLGWDYHEIPREESICEQTIRGRDLLVVENVAADKRFSAGALARNLGIRFYAGAPLLTKEGHALGTLCVMDRLPRSLLAEHKTGLLALASLLVAQLENRRSSAKASTISTHQGQLALLGQNVAGFFRLTGNGHILECNDTFLHILGYASRDEILQHQALGLCFSPDDRIQFFRHLDQSAQASHFECCLRKKNGDPVWVVANLTSATDPTDQAKLIEGIMVDISEHKRNEEALRDSQERLFSIINSTMDAIVTVDEEQRIVVFNKAAEQIFRCQAAEVIGESLDQFIPQNLREAHRDHIQCFGATGVSSRSMYSPGMLMGVRADGEEFPIEATISQVRAASKILYTVILRDVGVRKRTEDELRQAQKMEALGQLAGGIAHEFNNYLGIIMGYADLMAQVESPSDPFRTGLAEIKNATQKAASITRQLLAFGRRQVIEPATLDLNASIWETHKLLRRLIPANVDVIPVLPPDLGQVKADPIQIQQILINLVVNARDAMPQGGKITLETADVVIDEEYSGRHPDVRPGDYVMLSVTDTGQGIDAETLPHLFEPFFTTKKEGKGTGLGLSTTYGIVKQNGGYITVASVPGRGTTFRVYFPKMPLIVTSAIEGTARVSPPPSKTILVVDDESALRKLIRLTLEAKGYRVLEARNGAEALSFLEHTQERIDLTVTDLAMPHLTGVQLREKIAITRPDMRFLLISGCAEERAGHPEKVGGFADFLEKPFPPAELVGRVQALLNQTDEKTGVSPSSASDSRNPHTGKAG